MSYKPGGEGEGIGSEIVDSKAAEVMELGIMTAANAKNGPQKKKKKQLFNKFEIGRTFLCHRIENTTTLIKQVSNSNADEIEK